MTAPFIPPLHIQERARGAMMAYKELESLKKEATVPEDFWFAASDEYDVNLCVREGQILCTIYPLAKGPGNLFHVDTSRYWEMKPNGD